MVLLESVSFYNSQMSIYLFPENFFLLNLKHLCHLQILTEISRSLEQDAKIKPRFSFLYLCWYIDLLTTSEIIQWYHKENTEGDSHFSLLFHRGFVQMNLHAWISLLLGEALLRVAIKLWWHCSLSHHSSLSRKEHRSNCMFFTAAEED